MSKKEKLLSRLLSGNADANFTLDDLVNILIILGSGKRIFSNQSISET